MPFYLFLIVRLNKLQGDIKMTYVHTNIIAKDSEKLIHFYKEVFNCESIGQKRNLKGPQFDALTGIKNVHIIGEHLRLPGEKQRATLEIFSYKKMVGTQEHKINEYGFSHIAFEVDDVEETLKKCLTHGGSLVGELIHADYPDGRHLCAVYARDIENNIVEIMNWSYNDKNQ